MKRTYHADGAAPAAHQVFVFGSNLSGFHAGGAARAAHELHGAEWGVGEGRTGNAYAIPTVGANFGGPLTLSDIRRAVEIFLHHAAIHPEDAFLVTRVGCGIAGHKDEDIAPMFRDAPFNCSLPEPWQQLVEPAGSAA